MNGLEEVWQLSLQGEQLLQDHTAGQKQSWIPSEVAAGTSSVSNNKETQEFPSPSYFVTILPQQYTRRSPNSGLF